MSDIYTNNDVTYNSYEEPESPSFIPGTQGSGVAVITIAGAVGPNVSFGGTTGLTFIGGGATITVAGTLVAANGGTGQSSYTKGDLLVATGATALNKRAVGANGTVLTADSGETDGVKWAAASGGTVTSFSATPSGIFDVATATTTPALSLDNQSANTFLRGPTTGAAATPSFGVLVNADLPSQAWTSWTPTWTNLTVGNAVVVAKYTQIGKLTIGRLSIVLGTTSSVSGLIQFDLPVTSVTYASAAPHLGPGTMRDTVPDIVYLGYIQWLSTGQAVVLVENSSGTYLSAGLTSATVPFTWTTGDEISCEFYYEAA